MRRAALALFCLFATFQAVAQKWQPLNADELKMTSVQNQGGALQYERSDIPAFEREENMPPFRQLAIGVYIYYGGSDTKPEEFWRNEGKEWAKSLDHFIGHAGTVQEIALQAAPAN